MDEKRGGLRERYKVRESYANQGLKCFRASFWDFLENLGPEFQDKGSELGKQMVTFGYYGGEDIRIKMLHSGKILHGVYIRYEGDDPDGDLKELREYMEEMGLKRTNIKVSRLEEEAKS